MVHEAAKLVQFLEEAFGATGDLRPDVPAVMRIGDALVMGISVRGSALVSARNAEWPFSRDERATRPLLPAIHLDYSPVRFLYCILLLLQREA